MSQVLREPLFHFLLSGAVIFGVFGTNPNDSADEPAAIVVNEQTIDSLVTRFARTFQRPPTQDEIDGLIRDYVREEVYSREAIALGLDRDDTIIRRRLRQKLEFVSEDIATQIEPTDDELRNHLAAHPDRFRLEPRFSFVQVYLDTERRRETLAADAASMLTLLSRNGARADLSSMGDPTLLEQRLEQARPGEIADRFGPSFAAKLVELPLGQWLGPIESAYGAHLVFVESRTEGRLPELEEVRGAVRREYENAQRLEANERYYRSLLARYHVTIESRDPQT